MPEAELPPNKLSGGRAGGGVVDCCWWRWCCGFVDSPGDCPAALIIDTSPPPGVAAKVRGGGGIPADTLVSTLGGLGGIGKLVIGAPPAGAAVTMGRMALEGAD